MTFVLEAVLRAVERFTKPLRAIRSRRRRRAEAALAAFKAAGYRVFRHPKRGDIRLARNDFDQEQWILDGYWRLREPGEDCRVRALCVSFGFPVEEVRATADRIGVGKDAVDTLEQVLCAAFVTDRSPQSIVPMRYAEGKAVHTTESGDG